MSYIFSLHDEKLRKTKFAENEMTTERADEMMDEMVDETNYFAGRNGGRKILFCRTKWWTNIFILQDEMVDEKFYWV